MNRRYGTGFVMLAWIVGMLTVSCWQEQHHDIIPPTLPNYPVSGRVFDSADREPVEGIIVTLGTAADTTDSTGAFLFQNIQGGKTYGLSIADTVRYERYADPVQVSYDTVEIEDIYLGRIIHQREQFNPGTWGSFSPQGIVWLGDNLWSADSMDKVIYMHNYDSYMTVNNRFFLPNYPLKNGQFFVAPLGLEQYQNYLITYDVEKKSLYELIITGADTVLIQKTYRLPGAIAANHDLWDFAYDGVHLWSCSPGLYKNFHEIPGDPSNDAIFRHSSDLSIAETFSPSEIDPDILNPTGIAWDGEKFWLNSRGTHRLYMLDEEMHVLGYYVYEEIIWSWTPYQISLGQCQGAECLWGCFRDSWAAINSVGGPTQYLFKFDPANP